MAGGALPPQSAALAHGKRLAEFLLHQPRQRQVQIVAAQQQMLSHRRAREIHAIALAPYANQREVAGAAAHVAHQHDLPVEQALLRPRQIVRDPGIKRRRRFFEQRQLLDAGLARGDDGQLASLFIKARGHRQHHVVLANARTPLLRPRVRHALQNARRDFHRREHSSRLLRIPGKNLGGAVHFRIRKPALGRMDAFGRHQRALLAREHAQIFLIAQIQKRRQSAPRLDAALRHVLRNLQDANRRRIRFRGLLWVDVRERGVGGAEIDADVHSRTLIRSRARPPPALRPERFAADPPWRLSTPYDATALPEPSRSGERCRSASPAPGQVPRFW